MSRSLRQIASPVVAGGAALVLLAFGGTVYQATAAAPADRSSRQVRLMSRILDDALIESRNWLVRGGSVTQGLYLPDFGAVFQFEASINGDPLRAGFLFGPGVRVEIDKNDDGDIVVHRRRGLRDLLSRDEKPDEDTVKLYEKGKAELVQVLVDNAEVLSALPAGRAVVVSVALTDGELKEEKEISQLMIRISTDDLKAFGENRISETDLKGRIKVEES